MQRPFHAPIQPSRQRGATFLGMLTILAILGFGLYAGIRLVPLYVEFMEVSRALEQVRTEFSGEPTTVPALRNALTRRWTVEDISTIMPEEIQIRRQGNVHIIHARYRAEAPFVANVSFAVDFDKLVEVPQ